jgi:hypothetical protein
VLPWPKFESTVAEAQTLAQPEDFDYPALLDQRYSSVRKFAPPRPPRWRGATEPAGAAAEKCDLRLRPSCHGTARRGIRSRGHPSRPPPIRENGPTEDRESRCPRARKADLNGPKRNLLTVSSLIVISRQQQAWPGNHVFGRRRP